MGPLWPLWTRWAGTHWGQLSAPGPHLWAPGRPAGFSGICSGAPSGQWEPVGASGPIWPSADPKAAPFCCFGRPAGMSNNAAPNEHVSQRSGATLGRLGAPCDSGARVAKPVSLGRPLSNGANPRLLRQECLCLSTALGHCELPEGHDCLRCARPIRDRWRPDGPEWRAPPNRGRSIILRQTKQAQEQLGLAFCFTFCSLLSPGGLTALTGLTGRSSASAASAALLEN